MSGRRDRRVAREMEHNERLDRFCGAQESNFRARYVSMWLYNTYMPKLTLSVDEKVVRRAKRYAAAQGTSVSKLVERYLDLLARPLDMSEAPPVLKMLRGAARGVSADTYRQRLARKYQ